VLSSTLRAVTWGDSCPVTAPMSAIPFHKIRVRQWPMTNNARRTPRYLASERHHNQSGAKRSRGYGRVVELGRDAEFTELLAERLIANAAAN